MLVLLHTQNCVALGTVSEGYGNCRLCVFKWIGIDQWLVHTHVRAQTRVKLDESRMATERKQSWPLLPRPTRISWKSLEHQYWSFYIIKRTKKKGTSGCWDWIKLREHVIYIYMLPHNPTVTTLTPSQFCDNPLHSISTPSPSPFHPHLISVVLLFS